MHALESRTLEGHTSTARASESSHDCVGNAWIINKFKSSKSGTLETRSSETHTLQTHLSEIPVG